MLIVGRSEATRTTSNDRRTPSFSSVASVARSVRRPRQSLMHLPRSSVRPISRSRLASGGSRCRRRRSRSGRIWRRRRRGSMRSCILGTSIVLSVRRIRMVGRRRSRLPSTGGMRPSRPFRSSFLSLLVNITDVRPRHLLPLPTRRSRSRKSTISLPVQLPPPHLCFR